MKTGGGWLGRVQSTSTSQTPDARRQTPGRNKTPDARRQTLGRENQKPEWRTPC